MIEIAFVRDVAGMRADDQLGLESLGFSKIGVLSQHPISLPDKDLLHLSVQMGFGLFDQDEMERRNEGFWLSG